MVSNPLPQLISLITTGKTLMENLGLFGSQQQQQQAPVVTLSPEAIALSQQMGIPASEAQGLIDMGIGFAANIEGQANVPGNNLGDVGFSGEPGGGPVSGEGMGAPPAEAAAGMGPGW